MATLQFTVVSSRNDLSDSQNRSNDHPSGWSFVVLGVSNYPGDHLMVGAIRAVRNENAASGDGHVIGVVLSVCRVAVLKRYALIGAALE